MEAGKVLVVDALLDDFGWVALEPQMHKPNQHMPYPAHLQNPSPSPRKPPSILERTRTHRSKLNNPPGQPRLQQDLVRQIVRIRGHRRWLPDTDVADDRGGED